MRRPSKRPFGPFYPPLLQPSVNHAERLAAVLDAAQREARTFCSSTAAEEREPAHVWLTGRTSEVEAFVAAVVDDWRRGIVSEEEASAALKRPKHAVQPSGNHMNFAGAPLGNGRERSRDTLLQNLELQSTLRQAIIAAGPVRPGRRAEAEA